MKILKKGKTKEKKLRGECEKCGCKIECTESETGIIVDRDSPEGALFVRCPECRNRYLRVG